MKNYIKPNPSKFIRGKSFVLGSGRDSSMVRSNGQGNRIKKLSGEIKDEIKEEDSEDYSSSEDENPKEEQNDLSTRQSSTATGSVF